MHRLNALSSPAALLVIVLAALSFGCEVGTGPGDDGGTPNPIDDAGNFRCLSEQSVACLFNVHHGCERNGEFLSAVMDDCTLRRDGRTQCIPQVGCAFCRPGERFCAGGNVGLCNDDGTDFTIETECDNEGGMVCQQAACRNLCEVAIQQRSYQGCEFYAADLDNLSDGVGTDASYQQFSVVVSNPSGIPTDVIVEQNNAAPGEEPVLEEIARVSVLPGDLEVLNLPRREVDGSSSFFPCTESAACGAGESCWCGDDLLVEDSEVDRDCRCRNAAGARGFNDGTHSALTSRAYRLRSVLPIIAYQFNPLDNVSVFSNDASLLLPTSAVGETYTAVGWPQTIAHSDNPNEDFSPGRDDEDSRAFLTIVGTRANTHVTVTFGSPVRRVIGLGERPDAGPGDVWEFDIGPFDVINLETGGFNADFTGTRIDASAPVSVFSGSEASDAPRFDTISNRQCCADHLEEQLFSNATLGREFFIGRMPSRSAALDAALITDDDVGVFNEPEYVRVVAVGTGTTRITTTLAPPQDLVELPQNESFIFTANQDFEMRADKAIAVLQVIASQQATGIPNDYPGGDPAIIAVPPVEQYRSEYVFLTPSLYAFDFATITARGTTTVLLDEVDIREYVDSEECTVGPADGVVRRMGDPPPTWLVYRCQFSFPDVIGRPNIRVDAPPETQNDGYHTIRATQEVGLTVYGFDAFVSYAYAGGLNLDPLE